MQARYFDHLIDGIVDEAFHLLSHSLERHQLLASELGRLEIVPLHEERFAAPFVEGGCGSISLYRLLMSLFVPRANLDFAADGSAVLCREVVGNGNSDLAAGEPL